MLVQMKALTCKNCNELISELEKSKNKIADLENQLAKNKIIMANLDDLRLSTTNVALKGLTLQNEKLEIALQTKDYLVKEMHHRIKNNLQFLSSLLALKIDHEPNKDTEILSNIIYRSLC